MTRVALAFALVVLVVETVVVGVLLHVSDGTDLRMNLALALPAGIVFGVAGLVALARRPENRTGVYLAAVGYLWPLNVLADAGTDWVFTIGYSAGELAWVPFTALVLVYPTGRFATRLDRALPLATAVLLLGSALLVLLLAPAPPHRACAGCAGSAIEVASLPGAADTIHGLYHVGVLALIALVVVRVGHRWRGASPALRRLAWPVLGGALASLLAIGLVVVAEELAPGLEDALRVVFFIAFATIPLAFLVGILRVRLARTSVAEVVMALERGTALRDALADALGDPSLEVAYRLDSGRGVVGGDGWVDPLGHAVPDPTATAAGRAVRFIDRDGERIAAIAYDASFTNEPELVDAVTAAAGLAIWSERLQAELRAEITLAATMTDTAPALLTTVDNQGRILTLNPAALQASGCTHESDVRGQLFWNVYIDPDEREAMIARFAVAAAEGFPPAEYENAFTNARGERRVIYWRSAPVHDERGDVMSIVAGGLDITERKRREEEARAGDERLGAIIDNAPVAIVEIDLDLRVIHWNPAAEQMFGWTAEEIVGQPTPLIPSGHEDEFQMLLDENRADRARTGFETVRRRKDGSLIDVELSAAPIRDAGGDVVGHMAVFSDITERRMRVQEAERQRRFLNAITEAVPSFLVAVDPAAVVVEHNNNRAFLEAFGWSNDEIVGRSFLGLIARDDDHAARIAIANAANGVPQPEQESIWMTRAGEELHVAWTARPVMDPEGRPLVLVSGRDVTVSRRQEEELRASRARIVRAEDETRRKLERNLHDGAQQRLVALSVSLRLAETKLREDPEKAAAILASAREELSHALEELRELARGIHPAVLTDRGLGPALEALVARTPIPVDLSPPVERLAPAVEAAAYYVVAESLTNVAKYAQASSASVTVTPVNGHLEVVVSDDGVGGADPEAGSGLRGLADRVAALEGRLVVESAPGAGTRVSAAIPLHPVHPTPG